MLSQHFGINMADCPELMKVYDGVVAEPIIKKWLEERPKTDHGDTLKASCVLTDILTLIIIMCCVVMNVLIKVNF